MKSSPASSPAAKKLSAETAHNYLKVVREQLLLAGEPNLANRAGALMAEVLFVLRDK